MKKIQMGALALTLLVGSTQLVVAESNVVRLGAVPVPPMGALRKATLMMQVLILN